MSATALPELSRAEWMRSIARLPRTRSNRKSKDQARYAAALGTLASMGIKLPKPDQSLYLLGYKHGMNAAMRWPKEAASTASTDPPKQKRPRKS